MDIIKIFTALNGFTKSCWQLFLLLTSCSRGRFWFTSISLREGSDSQSLTKLQTGLQVELQMTELFALLEQTVLVTLNVWTSWLIPWTLETLLERAGLLVVDGLTSWLTLLTLQTLRSVGSEQTVLLTFNGLMSLLTPLVLQTLRLVVLFEKTGLLTFNGLMC